MNVREVAEDYLASSTIKKLQPKTRVGYSQRLLVFADWCTGQGLTLEHITNRKVEDFIEHLKTVGNSRHGHEKTLSTHTLAGYVRVISAFLHWCLNDDEYGEVLKPLVVQRIKMPKTESKIVETFTDKQIATLLEMCKYEQTEMLKARSRVTLLLLLDTGIRAEEYCTLSIGNVHLEPAEPFIRVMGKGRKEREIDLSENVRRELRRYIRDWRASALDRDPVFIGRYHKPMTVTGLREMILRLARFAEITGPRFSPHTFRHTYAARYMRNGGDVYTLSRLLGHSEVSTTEEYLKSLSFRDVRHRRQAMDTRTGG